MDLTLQLTGYTSERVQQLAKRCGCSVDEALYAVVEAGLSLQDWYTDTAILWLGILRNPHQPPGIGHYLPDRILSDHSWRPLEMIELPPSIASDSQL